MLEWEIKVKGCRRRKVYSIILPLPHPLSPLFSPPDLFLQIPKVGEGGRRKESGEATTIAAAW